MQAAVKQPETEPSQEPQVSERSLIFRRCKAAFQEIQKHGTPPDPTTYALWYAYVARTRLPEVSCRCRQAPGQRSRSRCAMSLAEIHREHTSTENERRRSQ